jgi:hypothetical protein
MGCVMLAMAAVADGRVYLLLKRSRRVALLFYKQTHVLLVSRNHSSNFRTKDELQCVESACHWRLTVTRAVCGTQGKRAIGCTKTLQITALGRERCHFSLGFGNK